MDKQYKRSGKIHLAPNTISGNRQFGLFGPNADCHKQLCLLWNSAIRRMTKKTQTVNMIEMKRLFSTGVLPLDVLFFWGCETILANGVDQWLLNQKGFCYRLALG